jgi:hypothetical protein
MDFADVRLVDHHPDLYAGQILGDQKEAGCVQAVNHRLSDVDAPIDDDPFDRRSDRAIA